MKRPHRQARAGENAAISSQRSNRSCREILRAEAVMRYNATTGGRHAAFHRRGRRGDLIGDIGKESKKEELGIKKAEATFAETTACQGVDSESFREQGS